MTPAEALGRALTLARVERGMSRRCLAETADISYPYLSEIEVGHKEPSPAKLRAIADGAATTPAALLSLAERLLAGDDVLAVR